MRELVIVGASGSSRDIVELVEDINRAADVDDQRWVVRGMLDDDPAKIGTSVSGVPVVGPVSAAATGDAHVIIGIASSRNRKLRREIVARLGLRPDRYPILVHPTASVSPRATVGRGTVLLHHVIVGPQASLGEHNLICAFTTIGHDAAVSDFCTMAPHVAVSGGVRLDACVYVGSGARFRENVRVGEGCLVGIGSVVLGDIDTGRTAFGNPARVVS